MCCRFQPFALAGIVFLAAACAPSAPEPVAPVPSQVSDPSPLAQSAAADPLATDAVPDRDTDPIAFWDLRVEQLFEKRDLDHSGGVTRDEFGGMPSEFDNIDGNKDGQFTKDELRTYIFARYVMAPQSPAE